MRSKIWKVQDHCATCTFPLDLGVFPEDFPKEWMFCCSCLSFAKFLTEPDCPYSDEEMIRITKNSPTISKIYDKITLVKGNDR